MEKKLILPKFYTATLDKYKQHNGKPKLSYSQIGSFKSPEYKNQYIRGYMFGIPDEGSVWATYGSHCGEYIETNGKQRGDMLSDADCEFLNTVPRFEGGTYESEIVIDRGNYCIQGFSDLEYPDNSVENGHVIVDYKTGAKKKYDQYASQDYMQTRMYAYQRENEGKVITNCYVNLLERLGNGRAGHPIRLAGVITKVPTPYKREDVEEFLLKVDKVAEEISSVYQTFLKLNSYGK